MRHWKQLLSLKTKKKVEKSSKRAVRTAALFLYRPWTRRRLYCHHWKWSCWWSVQFGLFQKRNDCRQRKTAGVWDCRGWGAVLSFADLTYLEEPIKLPRLSPILRLSWKALSWLLEPLCHSFLRPCSLLWRSTTTCRLELNGCTDRWVWRQKSLNCQQQSLYENQGSSYTKWSMKRRLVGYPTFQQLNYVQNSLFCLSM